MPTQIARVGSNLPNGNFIPEIWTKKLQSKFYAQTVLDMVTNHNYEGEIKGGGSKVYIRVRPTITVSDYVENSVLTYQDLADDKVELLIDKAKSFSFKIGDIDKYQSNINIINEATIDSAEQMKIHIEKTMFGSVYVDAGIQAVNTQINKATVLDWIVDQGVALTEQNVPTEGRFFIIPPWIGGMIQKSDLKDASISGDSQSLLRAKNGYLGDIAGFKLYVSNNLTGTGATSGVPTHCLAGTKHAITFASQFTNVGTVQLQERFGTAVRGLNVYGFKVEQPIALVDAEAYK